MAHNVAPAEGMITERARTIKGVVADPFHGTVVPGSQDYGIEWPFGIHRAVGGDHDGPNPRDLLCAALATRLESTIRIIANRLAITLVSLEVDLTLHGGESPMGSQATHVLTDHVSA